MPPFGDAAFANAGAGTVNFAARPDNGAWKNDFQLQSGKNLQWTFGTGTFDIVLVTSADKKVSKTLATGQSYVIFFDGGNGQWDIVLADNYHG